MSGVKNTQFEKLSLKSGLTCLLSKSSSSETTLNSETLLFLSVFSEKEIKGFDSTFTEVIGKNYGGVNPKVIYPKPNSTPKYILFLPKNEPKSIFMGDSHAGSKHRASHYGFLVGDLLKKWARDFSKKVHVILQLSEDLQDIIGSSQSDFILGLLQSHVTSQSKKTCQFTLELKGKYWLKSKFEEAYVLHNAMIRTRSLIHYPANVLNPDTYEDYVADSLKQLKKSDKNQSEIHFEVIDSQKLATLNCDLINAVGKGSQNPPRIIKLHYLPKHTNKSKKHSKKIALVGKGITFDSGGYDIKQSAGMRLMKKDMGGSAACFGIFYAVCALGLDIEVSCYLAVAENMISEKAMRPGDVYQSRAGKMVEVENTDAEGRMILADAIALAKDGDPDFILDIATLTGAARISLGPALDSFFTNDNRLSEVFLASSKETGDWIWPMPLVSEYEGYFESQIADFTNSGGAFAGSITAALFLEKFVGETPWAHIDSYMWTDKPRSLWGEGMTPTGKCIRLVIDALQRYLQKSDVV